MSKWIGADEQLPKPDKSVLGTDGKKVFEARVDKGGIWYTPTLHVVRVLYWMPMTEKPGGKNG